MHEHDHTPDSTASLERSLRDHRLRLDALELDRLRSQVATRISSNHEHHRSGGFMRSRLAVTLTVVLGLAFSGTGGALALSGNSGSGSASVVQYVSTNKGNTKGSGGVLGVTRSGGGSGTSTGTNSGGGSGTSTGTNSGNAGNNGQGVNAVQSSAQVEATNSGSSLPFTGYAAIPVLLVGVALLGTGFVMRRRYRDE